MQRGLSWFLERNRRTGHSSFAFFPFRVCFIFLTVHTLKTRLQLHQPQSATLVSHPGTMVRACQCHTWVPIMHKLAPDHTRKARSARRGQPAWPQGNSRKVLPAPGLRLLTPTALRLPSLRSAPQTALKASHCHAFSA